MRAFVGVYYDGKSSAGTAAQFQIDDNGTVTVLAKRSGEILHRSSFENLQISPRVGNINRQIGFANQAKFETSDNKAVDSVIEEFGATRWNRFIFILENKKKYLATAILSFAIFIWALISFGLPYTAKVIAHQLPLSILNQASEQSLEILDQVFTNPTQLHQNTRNRILNHFQPVIEEFQDYHIQVEFRNSSAIGPNVLALPNGKIIYTDAMVELANNDQELLSVLVHEIGHVVERHGLRNLVQDSLLGFLILGLTGDVSGASELFVGVPVVLTQLSYSRDFEREADQFALDYLLENNISTAHFANLLRRLDHQHNKQTTAGDSRIAGYLSSHPDVAERLIPFENRQKRN